MSTREYAMDLFDQLMEKSSWAAQRVLAEMGPKIDMDIL
jgi:hypothetical protein